METASWTALGTTAVVRCPDGGLSAARSVVEHELAAIDRTCSRFRDDSELSRVNESGGRCVAVSALFAEALETALWAASVTHGAVDPTIGRALIDAGYDRDFGSVRPSRTPLSSVRVLGWQLVELDRRRRTVRMPAAIRLDLGATAKALAADRAARAAAARTGCGVLVNLGGDIATAGRAPCEGWLVRVGEDHRDPSRPGQTVAIASGGLATSSTTLRAWRRGDAVAHHIIDPAAGRPALGLWRTATVAAASCVEANTASTAAIVRGSAARRALECQGLHARLVAIDGAVTYVGAWPAGSVSG